MDTWKRRFLLETIILRFHVSFQGCTLPRTNENRLLEKEKLVFQSSIFFSFHLGVSKNRGNYLQIIHFNRVWNQYFGFPIFSHFHHPFWGVKFPLFLGWLPWPSPKRTPPQSLAGWLQRRPWPTLPSWRPAPGRATNQSTRRVGKMKRRSCKESDFSGYIRKIYIQNHISNLHIYILTCTFLHTYIHTSTHTYRQTRRNTCRHTNRQPYKYTNVPLHCITLHCFTFRLHLCDITFWCKFTLHYNAILRNTMQCNNTIPHDTIQYNSIQYNMIQSYNRTSMQSHNI